MDSPPFLGYRSDNDRVLAARSKGIPQTRNMDLRFEANFRKLVSLYLVNIEKSS